jgi:uncharacterized protein (UPF0332 family)
MNLDDLLLVSLGILVAVALAAMDAFARKGKKSPRAQDLRADFSFSGEPLQPPNIPRPFPTPSATFRDLNASVSEILRDAAREANTIRSTPTPFPFSQRPSERVSGKSLIENWRKSIVGLVRLAESNLQVARSLLAIREYNRAVKAAATSVENISRALLHCYGEKPDLHAGQEESLRLVARRLKGEEKAQFEKAVEGAVQLFRNKVVQAYLLKRSILAPFLSQSRTEQILETAARIVTQFTQIIDEHFATEIPELREKCPQCGAVNITLWGFGSQGATYQCNTCRHKWVQPTQ